MLSFADHSLVTPGVFADSRIDAVYRAQEYGWSLYAWQERCLAAMVQGRDEYVDPHGEISACDESFEVIFEGVMDFLTWLASPNQLIWTDESRLVLCPAVEVDDGT
jgi:hypothetical protein